MDVKIVIETKSQMEEVVERLKASTQQHERSDEQRRMRWRLVFATPGSINVGTSVDDEPVYVTTRDINVEGMGFLCRQPLEVGQKIVATIDTDLGEVEVVGTVRHCTATVGMYKIGIKFDLIEPDAN